MNEDELSNSLASWVPPWQRVTKPDEEPDTDEDDEQRPETDFATDDRADDDGAGLSAPNADSAPGDLANADWARARLGQATPVVAAAQPTENDVAGEAVADATAPADRRDAGGRDGDGRDGDGRDADGWDAGGSDAGGLDADGRDDAGSAESEPDRFDGTVDMAETGDIDIDLDIDSAMIPVAGSSVTEPSADDLPVASFDDHAAGRYDDRTEPVDGFVTEAAAVPGHDGDRLEHADGGTVAGHPGASFAYAEPADPDLAELINADGALPESDLADFTPIDVELVDSGDGFIVSELVYAEGTADSELPDAELSDAQVDASSIDSRPTNDDLSDSDFAEAEPVDGVGAENVLADEELRGAGPADGDPIVGVDAEAESVDGVGAENVPADEERRDADPADGDPIGGAVADAESADGAVADRESTGDVVADGEPADGGWAADASRAGGDLIDRGSFDSDLIDSDLADDDLIDGGQDNTESAGAGQVNDVRADRDLIAPSAGDDRDFVDVELADASPADANPTSDYLVDELLVDDSPANGGPADASLADDSQAESSPVESNLIGASQVDDSAIDDSLIDDSAIDDSLIDDSAIDDSLVDDRAIDYGPIGDSPIDGGPIDSGPVGSRLVEAALAEAGSIFTGGASAAPASVRPAEPAPIAAGDHSEPPSIMKLDDRHAVDSATKFMIDGIAGGAVAEVRPDNLGAALEAILLVVDEPVADDVLAEVVEVPVADVTDALIKLAADYAAQGRGFDLRRAAGGWRFYTRGEYSSYVERFVLDGQSVRLTQAALETLAVIAYQQPVTRSRMAAIRGVNCDGVVRTLVTRGLIEECGTQPDSGAFLYRTTLLFLEKLGLDSLDELPPLAPFLPDDVNGLADV